MPRFNFSSYISKNSLTDFSCLQDLDPQAEWEERRKSSPSDENVVFSQASTTSTGAVVSQASTTSTEVDRQLVSEINALTGYEYTLDDLGLGQLDISGDEDLEQNDDTEYRNDELENIKTESVKYEYSANSVEVNQSAVQRRDGHRMGIPSKTSPQKGYENPKSVSIKTEKKSPRSRTVSPSERYEVTTTRVNYSDKSHAEPIPEEPKPTEPVKSSSNKSQVKALVYLDNTNVLHTVKNTKEIKEFVDYNKSKPVLPSSYAVEDAIQRIQNVPVDQVSHFAHLGDYVRHLQANERICDVTVHIGTEKYAAHRICLACYSDYFADIFYSRSEKQRVPLTVRLKGIKPIAFEILLQYIYSGNLAVTPEVVGDLMTMAESLRIPMVKARVVDYLESTPLAEALAILMKERIFGALYDRAMIAVCEQFNTIRFEEVFLDIDLETLILILSNDNLNITTEMDVFNAAIRWIAYKMTNRREYLNRLIKCVRFSHMTNMELFHCNELTDLLKGCSECRQMFLEANWIATSRLLCKEDPFNLPIPKPRISRLPEPLPHDDFHDAHEVRDTHEIRNVDVEVKSPMDSPRYQTNNSAEKPTKQILAVGGFNPSSSRAAISAKSIDRYNAKINEWKHYCDLPEPRLHYAVAILNGKLYLTGGIDARLKVKHPISTNGAFAYDIKGNAWIKIMPMNSARMYHALCALYGMVYAVGGQDDNSSVLNSVECYNPATDNWFYVKPMAEARLGTGIGILDGKMLVAGGYGENVTKMSGMPVLDSVESFDPRSNRWTTMNKLRFPRCHGNIVTVNGFMYLCGGATRSYSTRDSVISSTSSIDIFNTDTDTWEHCSDMVVARHDAGTAAIGDRIYIIGGASTQTNRVLRSVECYDTSSRNWIMGIKDLPYPSKWIRCLSVAI